MATEKMQRTPSKDALLSALDHIDQYRGQARLSTWLASIVLNSARMQFRRKLSHGLVSLDENDEGALPVSVDSLKDPRPDPERS